MLLNYKKIFPRAHVFLSGEWVKTVGGGGWDRFEGITVDSSDNVYAVGYTSSIDGDITDGNNNHYDGLLLKIRTD